MQDEARQPADTAEERLPLVLWVEDNPADVAAMRLALEECRAELDLHVAVNALEAFRFLDPLRHGDQSRRPDLVLLDLNLPAVSGQRILEEMRALPAWRDLHVMVLTSSSHEADLNSVVRHGATICGKPAVWDEWLALCRCIAADAVDQSHERRQVPGGS